MREAGSTKSPGGTQTYGRILRMPMNPGVPEERNEGTREVEKQELGNESITLLRSLGVLF